MGAKKLRILPRYSAWIVLELGDIRLATMGEWGNFASIRGAQFESFSQRSALLGKNHEGRIEFPLASISKFNSIDRTTPLGNSKSDRWMAR
jgi:hypothetical protein